MLDQIICSLATELVSDTKSVHIKDLSAENLRAQFRSGKKLSCFFYLLVGFEQRNQIPQQTQNIDLFYQLNVTNTQCNIGREENPDVGINCEYEQDTFLQI